jgi:hypothetical protein
MSQEMMMHMTEIMKQMNEMMEELAIPCIT